MLEIAEAREQDQKIDVYNDSYDQHDSGLEVLGEVRHYERRT